ncbi:MAG: hypothetical protein JXI33_07810 [Candidatus Aminicenantes bacterium]|nr:hypothetical protein [Candidatus Aminicenantes bacterium]
MNEKKVLLLVGSPRGTASVSDALGSHLLSLLEKHRMATKKLLLYPALANEKKMTALLVAVGACSLLVLSFPLYVDQLPAPLIDLLRRIAERRQGRHTTPDQSLTAIVNCGFPETVHCNPARDITRIFAEQAGFHFLGCLAMGMGGAIGKRKLDQGGGLVRHQVKAMAQAAAYLAAGEEIPAAVIQLMGKAMMPYWFYKLAGNWGWTWGARKNRTSRRLNDQPYGDG